ncbi:MAG TPA: DUF4252 domain-containing protein [Terriglobales bacterium]|nr:DUF4252 domain-containing protein [Terriglobales bacterium]
MRRLAFIVGIFAISAAAQSLDLSSLDKLAEKAKEVNQVNLDAGQLRAAMNMFSGADDEDARQIRNVVSGIRSIQVRNLEFGDKGQYSKADVDAIRAQVSKMPGWTKIVESREAEEHDEVYLLTQNEKVAGLAVIAAEPKELTVVFINGSVSLNDLGKLHGVMGLPNIELGHDKTTPRPDSDKKK